MRAEIRFAPVECTGIRVVLRQIRNRDTDAYEHLSWDLAEVDVLQPGGSQPDWQADRDALIGVLRQKKLLDVYADRWMANQIAARTDGHIRTSRDRRIFGEKKVLDSRIRFTRETSLIVLTSDVAITRDALAAREVVMDEMVIGDHTLFFFSEESWLDRYAELPGVRWGGYAALQADDKAQSLYLLRRSVAIEEEDREAALVLMLQAYKTYQNHRDALQGIVRLMKDDPDNPHFIKLRERLLTTWTPRTSTPLAFKNGATLLSVTLPDDPVEAGRRLKFKTYWTADVSYRKDAYILFVHLVSGDRQISVDQVLLQGEDVDNQPFSETFVQEIKVPIPADAVGEYELRLGVYPEARVDRRDRIKGATKLKDDHRAYILPVSVAVEAP